MLDWFVLLTPLVALILILLLGFTGCALPRGGLANPLTVTVRFLPPAEPPVAEVQILVVPIDSPDPSYSSGDISRTEDRADPPFTLTDGRRQQRIKFEIRGESQHEIRCEVTHGGAIVVGPNSLRLSVVPDHHFACALFEASAGASNFDRIDSHSSRDGSDRRCF